MKQFLRQYWWIFLISALYLIMSVTAPISESSRIYGWSNAQVRFLQITVSLPFVISWIAGILGFSEILKYSDNLKDDYQKESFKNISMGIIILVASSIIPAFINLFKNRDISGYMAPFLTITANYMYVLLPLVAIYLIYSAGVSLARSVNAPRIPTLLSLFAFIFPLAFSALNVYLTLSNPSRQLSIDPSIQASYYLPDFMIVATILIPSIVTWFLGTTTLLHIQNYSTHIKGTVFQSAISLLSLGLFFTVISSIFLQLLLALGSSRLLSLGVNLILGVIYLFIILQTTGYILIAFSSIRFSRVDKILSRYLSKST